MITASVYGKLFMDCTNICMRNWYTDNKRFLILNVILNIYINRVSHHQIIIASKQHKTNSGNDIIHEMKSKLISHKIVSGWLISSEEVCLLSRHRIRQNYQCNIPPDCKSFRYIQYKIWHDIWWNASFDTNILFPWCHMKAYIVLLCKYFSCPQCLLKLFS